MENTTMFGGSLWIWVIFIGFTVISWLISHQLKSRFQKYSKIPTANGMTGRDVVEKMLRDNGVTGVKIGSVEGMLTDHYNPVNKTINLSRDVYYGNSIAAAAVAAHETGHALQHAKGYSMLKLGAGSRVRFPLGTMDFAGRYPDGEQFSGTIAGRDRAFCHYDLIQFRYLTGRDRCQSPRISLAAQFRNHGLSNPGICFRCFEMGSLYLCDCSSLFTGHLALLHHDLFKQKRLTNCFMRQFYQD